MFHGIPVGIPHDIPYIPLHPHMYDMIPTSRPFWPFLTVLLLFLHLPPISIFSTFPSNFFNFLGLAACRMPFEFLTISNEIAASSYDLCFLPYASQWFIWIHKDESSEAFLMTSLWLPHKNAAVPYDFSPGSAVTVHVSAVRAPVQLWAAPGAQL